jgi:hypothetical protein
MRFVAAVKRWEHTVDKKVNPRENNRTHGYGIVGSPDHSWPMISAGVSIQEYPYQAAMSLNLKIAGLFFMVLPLLFPP